LGHMATDEIVGKSGAVTGIIYPPPDVRSIVDKTAEFVARNGETFENRIKAKESANLKFGFLNADDPYNAYYKFKVNEIKSGIKTETKTVDKDEVEKKANEEKKQKEAQKAAIIKKAKHSVAGIYANLAKNLSDEPPKPEQFTLLQHRLAPVDREIVKLTAQYTAVSGRQFLSGLARKEAGNPQFEFLKPTHVLFGYFTALCDQYAKVLNPSKDLTDKIAAGIKDKMNILQRCVHKLEFKRKAEREKAEKEASENKEKMIYQSIDWHDFVIVEVIEFDDDDEALPPPLPPQPDVEAEDEDMDMEMDVDEDPPLPAPLPAAPAPPPAPARPAGPDYDYDEEINIRKDYQPTHKIRDDKAKFMIDQRTGERIDIARSAEHVRISLVDPRYKYEQQKSREKSKETAMARDEQIAQNLKSLSQARPDIFGGDEFQAEEKRGPPKSSGGGKDGSGRVIWDGHTASVSAVQQQAMERQIEQIKKQAYARTTAAPDPDIGPARPVKGVAPGAMPLIPMRQVPPPRQVAPPPPPVAKRMPAPPPPPPAQRQLPKPPMPTLPQPTGLGRRPAPPPPPPPPHRAPPPQPPRQQPPSAPMYGRGMPHAMPPHMMQTTGMMGVPPPQQQRQQVPATAPANNTSGTNLVSEAEWLQKHPGSVKVRVQVPSDSGYSNWNFNGQQVTTSLDPTATVRDLKQSLSSQLGGMPANKQQLKHPAYGFMKDAKTLAHYNISSINVLKLVPRKRGRR